MRRRACDACGKDLTDGNNTSVTHKINSVKECDKTATITAKVNFGFTGHSTGFGGPPDLCDYCILSIIGDLHENMEEFISRRESWVKQKSV